MNDRVEQKDPILLHTCCGPCSTRSIEVLGQDYAPTIFWSNSNIAPREEYEKRLLSGRKVAKAYRLEFVEDTYDHNAWLDCIAGEETAPERGARCAKCFAFSFRRTSAYARENGYHLFTTTLTISPHKDAKTIFRIGQKIAVEVGLEFIAVDLKKNGGFQKSIELSKSLQLYRQKYCGCEFSIRS